MATTVVHQGHTDVTVYTGHGTAEDRAAAARLIDRYVAGFASGMHAADDLTLAHERDRLDGLRPSPAIQRMRQIVADEQSERAGREVAVHA